MNARQYLYRQGKFDTWDTVCYLRKIVDSCKTREQVLIASTMNLRLLGKTTHQFDTVNYLIELRLAEFMEVKK